MMTSGGSGDKKETGNANTLPAGTYSAGQEIVHNGTGFETLTAENANSGEHFYVIGDDGNSVRLLAKYCLSKTANEQLTKDATYNDYGRRFSQNNYWTSISGITYPYDLQSTEGLGKLSEQTEEDVSNNAIIKAQEYGVAKGVEGRLMDYTTEALAIKNGEDDTMKNILWGKWTDGTQPTQGYLLFWLGAANNTNNVWNVNGNNSNLNNNNYTNTNNGVRPAFYNNLGPHYYLCVANRYRKQVFSSSYKDEIKFIDVNGN